MFDRVGFWDWEASLTPAGEAMNESSSFEEYELRLDVSGDENQCARSLLVRLFASFLGTSMYLKFYKWTGYVMALLTGFASGLMVLLESWDTAASFWTRVLRIMFDIFVVTAAGVWLQTIVDFFCFVLAVRAMSSLVSWRYEPFRKAKDKSLFERFMDCLAFRRVREWYHARKWYLDGVRKAN